MFPNASVIKNVMKIDLITLFPEMASGFLSESMLAQAQKKGILQIGVHDLRKWSNDPKHNRVDDRPFGGGAGMLLKPEPIFDAIEALKTPKSHVVYLAPDGEKLSPKIAENLAKKEHIIFLSGHYEGIDERAREKLFHQEISIGEYILTNGTLPACVVIDCLCRFVPGVLGNEKSLTNESFCNNLLSFPQYTRPAEYKGMRVPEVLMEGNHAEIEAWRKRKAAERKDQRTEKF
jgi:tRNA (guanine37-N1)-methyltransferase